MVVLFKLEINHLKHIRERKKNIELEDSQSANWEYVQSASKWKSDIAKKLKMKRTD